ncbi:MAG TPA: cell division protein FtsB [Gammaproteobacteria bacterium]
MRPLIAALVVALAVLQFRLWVADGGFREVWRLEARVEEQTNENRLLAERNAALAAEVQDLKNGLAAAEERARSELGMVLPDESFYQIVPYEAVARANGAPTDAESAPSEQHVDGTAAAVSAVR